MIKRKIPLAWRQLIKTRGRFIVALSGIAFADILMLMQLGFQSALYDSNAGIHQLMKTDLVLVSSEAQSIGLLNTFSRRRLFQAKNLPEVKSTSSLYVRLTNWKNPQTKLDSPILVIGFNPVSSPFRLPEVKQNLNLIKYPYTILFDRASAGEYQQAIKKIAQGIPVTTEMQGRKVTIAGLYRVGASFIAQGSIMTSDQNYLRIFSDQQAGEVNIGLINLRPGSDANQVANQLRLLLLDDVKIFTIKEFIDFERKYAQTNGAIGFIFSLGAIMGFLVGIVIVYQILFSDVADHLPEYATLKAMGYSNTYLFGIVFQEALILAFLGYIPGFLISTGLYTLTRAATSLPLLMTLGRAIQVLILTIIMCAMSGLIAMQKLRSADPADIF